MKILRYRDPDGHIHHAAEHPGGELERLEGRDLFSPEPTGQPAQVREILAPLDPAAILCIGLNYKRHAEETGARLPEYPVLFMKNPACALAPGAPIEIPVHLASERVDYEAELAVVVAKPCKNVSPDNAPGYIGGYLCANDVSARDWQIERGGRQWCRGKSFDTFCPLGPKFVTADDIPDPQSLRIQTRLNGRTMQDSNTRDMIFPVFEIVSFLSGSTTLLPGTVILTGTPEGVGMARTPPVWLQPGDRVEIEIEGIGTLSNPVVREKCLA
jgi:2-keto-4-pentenoate hydratase/2-oxohepta-3-ene-1,7-dioic acid hydratase in catechol pathway